MNYSELKAAIAQVVKPNDNQEITGENLQGVLNAMVNSVAQGYLFAGVATPQTNPGTPDQKVMYIAATAGSYTNFGSTNIEDGQLGILTFDTSWHNSIINLDDSIRPYVVDEVNRAVASIQPIEITGDVTNAPDQEDLTSVNQGGTDVLKFKDKTYAPALFSGLGRVHLRKNVVTPSNLGYAVNLLTQQMVNTSNTIYVIQYDYDLNGQTITMPAGCVLDFDGGSIKNGGIIFDNTYIKGNAQMADITIDGTIANSVIESVWFGNTPTILSKLISIANASESRLELTPRYDYVVNEQVVVTLNNNFELIGNGANMEIASTGFIQFKNPAYLQQAATTDIARGATSYTFTSIPSSIKEGDLFIIKSSLNGESAYNTKRQFISIVGKISGNTIYFTDAVTLDFPASSTTLYFAKKGTSVRLKDLNFICNRGNYYVNIECSNTSPIVENCYFGGLNSSYGLHITDCVNTSINGLKIGTLTYGVLVNNSAHVNISNVAENEVGVHPVAIASFSNFVTVTNVSGIGALVECHTGFNITYDNCHFIVTPTDSWNIRGAGITLKNSSIHSSDGNPATNVLIGTMQLYDVNIYDDYMFKMFNCDLQMNAFDVSNSGIVDIDLCRFLPNTKIGMGRTNQARIKKGRIYRSENIEDVRIYNEFDNEFDTDMNNVDAVYDEDNNVYKISQFTSSIKYVEKVGKTSTHGFLKPLSTGASLSLPIQIHSRFWQHNYVEFLVKVQAANRASSFTYAEKTFKVMICYTKVGNYSNIMEVTDLTPSETRITLQASNLSHTNDTSQPSINAGYLNFTLDITTTIASASAARMNVSYECNSDILNW